MNKTTQTTNIVYSYDGSFDGLLCCVFASFDFKEIPLDIISGGATLLQTREIVTAKEQAARVAKGIIKKMGDSVLESVKIAYLTSFDFKERAILDYLRLGFEVGSRLPYLITDERVAKIYGAVKRIKREKAHFVEFIRFTDYNGALASIIDPEHFVLPLLSQHFKQRFPNEQFLIYDRTHNMALIYADKKIGIIPVEDYELPTATEEEQKYRALWRLFYNTVEVKPRHNEKCRMGHMPKKYWHNMTEFCTDGLNEKVLEF